MTSTLTERGQISIPASIRKRFKLQPGMSVMWLERDEGIFLMPVPEDSIKAFQNKLSAVGTKDLLEQRRADRLKENQ